jgi:sulfur carrier protein
MIIRLNGQPRELDDATRLPDLLCALDLAPGTVVAEYNLRVLKSEEFDSVVLKDGDALELIRFVGGG